MNWQKLRDEKRTVEAYRRAVREGAASVSDATVMDLPISAFELWQPDKFYDTIGEVVIYEGIKYRIAQPHPSQANWLPPDVPALYDKLTFEGGVQVWERPQAHNVIMKGERRLFRVEDGFDGNVYESLIDNNSWTYIEQPSGWILIN